MFRHTLATAILVALVACGGNPPATKPVVVAPQAPAEEAPPPIVVDVRAVYARLAGEKLAGTVVVMHGDHLFPTAAAARAAPATEWMRPNKAVRVLADHGDVVEVQTGYAEDCIDSWLTEGAELRGFVPRNALVPRLGAERAATFSDGTAYAIERGAPVDVAPTGLSLDGFLAGSPSIALTADALVLSIPAPAPPPALPAAPGPRLVCDEEFRGTKAEWVDWTLAHREAESGDDENYDRYDFGYVDDYRVPWCGVVESYFEPTSTNDDAWVAPPLEPKHAPPPTLDGHVVQGIPDGYRTIEVYASGGAFVADFHERCEHARVAVAREAVHHAAGGGVGMGGAGPEWSTEPGAATWPDGTAAGTFTTAETYRQYDGFELLADGRLCVHVNGAAVRVCHARADVKRTP